MELAIVVSIVGALSAAAIASTKNRSVIGWFVLGALFPLIALVAVIMLGDVLTLEQRIRLEVERQLQMR